MFDLSWFRTTFRTLDFPSVYKGLQTNWDFPNMVESINHQKSSPKIFLTPIFARKYKGFRNFHKDALGREKKNIKNDHFFVPFSTFLDAEMPYL